MRITGLLIILLIICFSFENEAYFYRGNATYKDKTTKSTAITKLTPPSEYVSISGRTISQSMAISINGNKQLQSLAQSSGWSGNGTKNDPILIQNIFFSDLYLTPEIVNIAIINTSLYLTIQTVYFEFLRLSSQPASRAGILLENASNIVIQNSYFISSIINPGAHMIDITNCSNLTIQNNYFNTTGSTAINIMLSSHITISSNFFKNNFSGINMGANSIDVTISENNFLENTYTILYSKGDSTQYADLNNSIIHNNFENSTIAINIFGGNFGLIQGNIMQDPSLNNIAMYLQRSLKTVIKDNFISGYDVGIELDQLENTYLLKSTCSTTNSIPECSEVGNSTSGSFLLHQSNITIMGNEFSNQNLSSIQIHNYTDGNIVYDNNFIEPTIDLSKEQVQVGLAQNTTNYFSNTGYGNYWTNYNGTDANNDGIGDTPYYINQKVNDSSPFMNPVNISQPILTVSNEAFYLTKLQVGFGGGTTIEMPPTFPVTPVYHLNTTNTTNIGIDLNNFFNLLINDPMNLVMVSTLMGTLVVSMFLANEHRKYSKTNRSENFRNYLTTKIKKNKKETKSKLKLSDTVFETLEEIIDENKLNK